jgi:hypothetical protein
MIADTDAEIVSISKQGQNAARVCAPFCFLHGPVLGTELTASRFGVLRFDPLANKETNVKSESLTFERGGMPRLSIGHMPGVHGPKSARQGRIVCLSGLTTKVLGIGERKP